MPIFQAYVCAREEFVTIVTLRIDGDGDGDLKKSRGEEWEGAGCKRMLDGGWLIRSHCASPNFHKLEE